MSKLLSVSQVAEQLSVCTETVYRAVKSGKLRGAKLPVGGWRIEESALLEFRAAAECPADEMVTLAATLHSPRGRRPRGFVLVGNDAGSAFAWSLLLWVLIFALGGQL